MGTFLPAEWYPQDGVIVTFPHEKSDWKPILESAIRNFLEIIKAVSFYEKVVLICDSVERVEVILNRAEIDISNIYLVQIDTDDTWVRDYGPISVIKEGEVCSLKFSFNAWGDKFSSELDNKATEKLFNNKIFKCESQNIDLILEGGSIESDGEGTLLTTENCLLSDNRNDLSKEEFEDKLKSIFGLKKVLWLKSGYLIGDDTDSHVDTLARFCDKNTICYVKCDDKNDDHFEELNRMEEELKSFETLDGKKYNLVPLPFPKAVFDSRGRRLPATYANFLIINDAVLVPTYNDENDKIAIETLSKVFPSREIVGIDCSTLIFQNGSLHCSTMQIPRGVLCE